MVFVLFFDLRIPSAKGLLRRDSADALQIAVRIAIKQKTTVPTTDIYYTFLTVKYFSPRARLHLLLFHAPVIKSKKDFFLETLK